jgi:methylenetetrahydrofolate reductase (NADPH)
MFPTRIEIVPSEGIAARVVAAVPLTTTLTVTCLPHHGIDRTLRTARQLAEAGYTVIPHLAAKALTGRSQLSGILRDCGEAGIAEVFAIGGDPRQSAGPYHSSLPLLEDIAEFSGGGITAGVAGYPEGHPSINGVELLDALLAKAHLATHLVTQMCFSATAILNYADLLRHEGVDLPVWAGIAGAVPRARLVSLASQIGVGASLKFLSRQGPLARRLLSGGRYAPEKLVAELAARPNRIAGIHLYSFNNLATDPDAHHGASAPAASGPASLQASLPASCQGAARDH